MGDSGWWDGLAPWLLLAAVGCGGDPQQKPEPGDEASAVEDFTCQRTLPDTLVYHRVCVDDEDKIVPWTPEPGPYADISARAWAALKAVPDLPNGKPTYYSSALFAGVEPDVWAPGKGLPHHPAGVLAMFVDSALSWYAYSGDEEVLTTVVLPFADHFLENGMTEITDSWSSVPYSCANFGSLTYHGSDFGLEIGDGYGYLEPDKVGEIGLAFLKLYQYSGDARYLETALACADALATHVKPGNADETPWAFRVDAATGQDVLDPYCAHIVGALRLFRELERLDEGDTAAFRAAHDTALDWALEFPFVNHDWSNYFEDVAEVIGQNRNQYSPLELARYLLENPDVAPDAEGKAMQLVDWVASVFAQDFTNDDGAGGILLEPGNQYGAEAISEQDLDTAKMGSHTARFASILALHYEKTGDEASRVRAFRSFNWATYCSTTDGIVNVGPNPREGFWFSDGYGDYIRHFMAGLGSIPEWAPAEENHLLRSSSVVQSVQSSDAELSYTTFDAAAQDVLRLAASPARIAVDGVELSRGAGDDQYTEQSSAGGGVSIRIQRSSGSSVTITF